MSRIRTDPTKRFENVTLVRETEKAVLLRWYTPNESWQQHWVPKSQIITLEVSMRIGGRIQLYRRLTRDQWETFPHHQMVVVEHGHCAFVISEWWANKVEIKGGSTTPAALPPEG